MLKYLPVLGCALSATLTLGACEYPLGTNQGYAPAQPIAYSHAQHAGDLQIPCLYCHYAASRGRHAGVPPAQVCMNCHEKVKKDAPEIQKVVTAIATGTPIAWNRVHALPDFAWFSHARHVTADIKCQTCHGPVETMTQVAQVESMTMGWCVDCHRKTLDDPKNAGKQQPPLDCGGCHY